MALTCGCCTCISTSEVGIKETFGKFNPEDGVLDPGCHCLNPCTQSISGRLSLRTLAINTRVDTKTLDNVLVAIAVTVMYKVLRDKVAEAFYRFSNPHGQIQSFVSNVIRGQVPGHNLDDIFIIRDELQKAIKNELDNQMSQYGYEIVATLVTDIDPNDQIKQAMSQINTNARLRVAMGYKADADKIEVIKNAEADAESKRLSGVGLAEQRKAAISGLETSVLNFQGAVKGVTSKDVLALLLMNQYFDCIGDIAKMSKGSVVFLPGQNAGMIDTLEGVMAAGQGQPRHGASGHHR